MSVNEKMTAIADAIRDKTGGTDKLGMDEMAQSIPGVFAAGEQSEANRWGAEYFKTSFLGSGTKRQDISIPFEPDVLLIQSQNHYVRAAENSLSAMQLDFQSCARYWGVLSFSNAGLVYGYSALTMSSTRNWVSYADGVLSIDPTAGTLASATWPANVRFDVTAAKFPNQTVRGLIEEEIALLPDQAVGTKTMEYTRSRINEYFTAEEWAALIATKPNWTFSMF